MPRRPKNGLVDSLDYDLGKFENVDRYKRASLSADHVSENVDRYKRANLSADHVREKRLEVLRDDGFDRPLRRPSKVLVKKIDIPAFEYKHLDPTSPGIRLIQLLAGGCWSRIKCTLEVNFVGSSRCKKYDAVSYVWGTGERTCPIDLNDAKFMVSPNVENILSRLRHEKEGRWLWIDLICINQEDEDEKADQVRQMKDIFSQAQTVIASLGPHEGYRGGDISLLGDSRQSKLQKALDLINSPQWRDWRDLLNKLLSEYQENCFLTLLEHPWFVYSHISLSSKPHANPSTGLG